MAGCPSDATAQEIGADEVFRWTRTLQTDGTVSESVEGSLLVTLADGTAGYVDPDSLTDADGSRYVYEGGTWQREVDGPTYAEVRLLRATPEVLDDAAIADAWREAHPDGTGADLAAFLTERDAAQRTPAEEESRIDPAVVAWADTAIRDDARLVWVVLREPPNTEIPSTFPALADELPEVWLTLAEERILAVETRKTEVQGLQAEVRRDVEERGGRFEYSTWLENGFFARLSPEAARFLADDDRVRSLELLGQGELYDACALGGGNTAKEIREAAGVQDYLDSGFDGEDPTGFNPYATAVFVGIPDTGLDWNHPAWEDAAALLPERMQDVYEPNTDTTPSLQSPADVQLKVCSDAGPCYTCTGTRQGDQRLWLGNAIAGHTWEVKVTGLSVPPSTDNYYLYNQSRRKTFVALYWES